MLNDSRSVFLLVRRFADLRRANEELAAYLSILRRQRPNRALGGVLGIWIDEEGVANLPSELDLAQPGGTRRTSRIVETMGINGIWMLCSVEAAPRTVSRVDLVGALLKSFRYEETALGLLEARFVPVFPSETSEHDATELHALKTQYPQLMLSPIYLDGNGTLLLPSAQSRLEKTLS